MAAYGALLYGATFATFGTDAVLTVIDGAPVPIRVIDLTSGIRLEAGEVGVATVLPGADFRATDLDASGIALADLDHASLAMAGSIWRIEEVLEKQTTGGRLDGLVRVILSETALMDRREAILARLLAIASGIAGVKSALRNVGSVSERARPGIVILDADEVVELPTTGSGKPARAPSIVSMTPEVVIQLQDNSEDVGSQLNAFRLLWLQAVLTNSEILGLVGPNGEVRYEGCATALSRGRTMEGEMGVAIAFLYPLKPSEF